MWQETCHMMGIRQMCVQAHTLGSSPTQKAPKGKGVCQRGLLATIPIFHTAILTAYELQVNGKKVSLFIIVFSFKKQGAIDMGNYVEVKYGLFLKDIPNYLTYNHETEELHISEPHPFGDGVINEYGHCLSLFMLDNKIEDERDKLPEGAKYLLLIRRNAKRAFEWFDGVIGIKDVLSPYLVDNHPNELGSMEDEDGVESYNGVIVLDKVAFIESHKERMDICEDCEKYSDMHLCENMPHCRRAFNVGKSTPVTSIKVSNGYTIIAESSSDGNVHLSAKNPDIGEHGDSWLLGVMTFDEEGRFNGKKF